MKTLARLLPTLPAGGRVLVRADLNVPMQGGEVASDERIRASVPTFRRLLERGTRVLVMSHLGRPQEGREDPAASLAPVAKALSHRLGVAVAFRHDWLNGVRIGPGRLALLENVRFLRGEKTNDDRLARRLAALCDLYVMDAFGSAHRAHASTHAIIRHAPRVCAGPLLVRELRMLERALANPVRPLVAIVGGAKVSTKIAVLEKLVTRADQLIVGGGIANTFLAARGFSVGDSLYEPGQLELATRLLRADRGKAAIPLPKDVVCESPGSARPALRRVAQVRNGERILDIGPQTQAYYDQVIRRAGTIVWNGPVGVFERPEYAAGTRALARSVADSRAFSIAGGGDTLAAVRRFQIRGKVSYLSTGGGAFLDYVSGQELPVVTALRERSE